jgi:hypothetical protein
VLGGNRERHAQHLPERLFDCYLADRNGETIDPPAARHLTDCEACAARCRPRRFHGSPCAPRARPAPRSSRRDCARSDSQIARRLEQVGRQARVISFPGQLVRRTMTASSSHSAPRWVAAAAAAGLFVGVAVGASYRFGARPRGVEQTLARQTPIAARSVNPTQVSADDAFLSDLEVALERPHTRELLAFDALTPHVREVTTR